MFIYVIQTEGAIKIGLSDNPQSRLKALQTSHYQELRLVYTLKCQDRDAAHRLELLLHKRYEAYHMTGEWFSLDSEVVVSDLEFLTEGCTYITGREIYKEQQVVPVMDESLQNLLDKYALLKAAARSVVAKMNDEHADLLLELTWLESAVKHSDKL